MRGRLYERVQRDLLAYIQDHDLRPGDPLPAEAELARLLDVSRMSLREATRTLQSLGVIIAKPGSGLFIRGFAFDAILQQLPYSMATDGRSLRELLQVREALECRLVTEAAGLLDSSQLERLEEFVADMDRLERAGKSAREPDRAFHLALFEPLGNQFLLDLIGLFWNLHHNLEQVLPPPAESSGAELHQQIVDALRAGDDPTSVVSHHFDSIRARLSDIALESSVQTGNLS